jgi:Ca-activated chloride channel family protein
LSAPAEAKVGAPISVTWTGPNYAGDYVTVVPIGTPDGQYRNYTYTKTGAPLNVKAPEAAGDCEIRYMTGQGDKVIARRPIRIAPL